MIAAGKLPPEFWQSRPELTALRQYAQARRVSPEAILAGVLARVTTAIPPECVLPPTVGTFASINSFYAVTARSGGGKGASQGAAAAWFQVERGLLRYTETTIGSGEGIAAAFAKSSKGEDSSVTTDIHTDSLLADIAEVDTLQAIAGRSGSTLTSELRKAWDGASIGFRNRSAERSVVVPAHSYRMALTVGVQPERAGALLDEAAGGFPQRFVWFSATDTYAPNTPPEPSPPMLWKPPLVPAREDGKQVIQICDEAHDTITTAAVARLRGEGNALDGHSLLARLKISALLALLNGSPIVRNDDWELSAHVMEAFNQVRQMCVQAIRDANRARNQASAEMRGEAEVTTSERVADVAVAKVKERVLKALENGTVRKGKVQARLSKALREYLDAAISELEDEGILTVNMSTYRGQEVMNLTLNPFSTGELAIA